MNDPDAADHHALHQRTEVVDRIDAEGLPPARWMLQRVVDEADTFVAPHSTTVSRMSTGLLHALLFDGKGGATPLDWDGLRAWTSNDGVLWVNLDYSVADAATWLPKTRARRSIRSCSPRSSIRIRDRVPRSLTAEIERLHDRARDQRQRRRRPRGLDLGTLLHRAASDRDAAPSRIAIDERDRERPRTPQGPAQRW